MDYINYSLNYYKTNINHTDIYHVLIFSPDDVLMATHTFPAYMASVYSEFLEFAVSNIKAKKILDVNNGAHNIVIFKY